MFVIVINLQFVVKQYPSEFLKDQLEPDKGHFGRIVGIFRKSSPVKTGSLMIGGYLLRMYPSAHSSSASRTAPPAAPRRVLWERQTNL